MHFDFKTTDNWNYTAIRVKVCVVLVNFRRLYQETVPGLKGNFPWLILVMAMELESIQFANLDS